MGQGGKSKESDHNTVSNVDFLIFIIVPCLQDVPIWGIWVKGHVGFGGTIFATFL